MCNQSYENAPGTNICRYSEVKGKKRYQGIMPIKGYIARARVFGYLMLALALLYILYYFFGHLI